MSILLTEEQAALSGLYSRGEELLQRYRDVLEDAELSTEFRRMLSELCEARERLLAELADAQRASGMLPKAGNSERATLEALSDQLATMVGKRDSLVGRLRTADSEWLADVEEARTMMNWSSSELALFERLAEHLKLSNELLGKL